MANRKLTANVAISIEKPSPMNVDGGRSDNEDKKPKRPYKTMTPDQKAKKNSAQKDRDLKPEKLAKRQVGKAIDVGYFHITRYNA